MSHVFLCNLSRSLQEGNRKAITCHITMDHLGESRVPYYCSLCHFRARNRRTMEFHLKAYRLHREKSADMENSVKGYSDYITENLNPYYIDLGTDANVCDAILKNSV